MTLTSVIIKKYSLTNLEYLRRTNSFAAKTRKLKRHHNDNELLSVVSETCFYDSQDKHEYVAESAVVGIPHEIKGEGQFSIHEHQTHKPTRSCNMRRTSSFSLPYDCNLDTIIRQCKGRINNTNAAIQILISFFKADPVNWKN